MSTRHNDLLLPSGGRAGHSPPERGYWDERATCPGLAAVLTTRWSPAEHLAADRAQRELLRRVLPHLRHSSVLDLGCGIGRLTTALSRRARAVVGVDASHAMLRRAVGSSGSAAMRRYVAGVAERLPFQDRQFDVVVAVCVFQHLLDARQYRSAVAEMSRVMRRGGRAFLLDGVQGPGQLVRGPTPLVLRTWREYSAPLSSRLRLLEAKPMVCLTDSYLMTLWKRP